MSSYMSNLMLLALVRIATKGGFYWITEYRLTYSDDCVSFNNVLDGTGNNAVIIIPH